MPLGPLETSNSTAWPSFNVLEPSATIAEKWTKTSSPLWRWMKPKPLLALNHFTVPCSLLTALLFSVSRGPAEHNIKLSDAPSPEPLNRAAAVFKLRSARPQSGLPNKKMAASVTLRPLYYPKAIQEQQTQRQSTTVLGIRQGEFLSLWGQSVRGGGWQESTIAKRA